MGGTYRVGLMVRSTLVLSWLTLVNNMIVGAEVEKREPHDGTMSKLLKGLIKVSFIPINTDSNYRKCEFRLISKETLKFFTIWYGLHIAILVSLVMLFKDSIITAYYLEKKNNPIDLVAAGIFSFCLWWIFPMSPLFLGSTVAKIPSTVWKKWTSLAFMWQWNYFLCFPLHTWIFNS